VSNAVLIVYLQEYSYISPVLHNENVPRGELFEATAYNYTNSAGDCSSCKSKVGEDVHALISKESYILNLTKMYCYSDASQNSPQAKNFSYMKQYSNQSGLMEYNSGVRLPLPT
jgi:hypothetical protein